MQLRTRPESARPVSKPRAKEPGLMKNAPAPQPTDEPTMTASFLLCCDSVDDEGYAEKPASKARSQKPKTATSGTSRPAGPSASAKKKKKSGGEITSSRSKRPPAARSRKLRARPRDPNEDVSEPIGASSIASVLSPNSGTVEAAGISLAASVGFAVSSLSASTCLQSPMLLPPMFSPLLRSPLILPPVMSPSLATAGVPTLVLGAGAIAIEDATSAWATFLEVNASGPVVSPLGGIGDDSQSAAQLFVGPGSILSPFYFRSQYGTPDWEVAFC